MRKRAERAQVWLTLEEKEDLRAKASAACMDEGRFIRMLIKGYTPRPAPDEQFYKTMELIRTMGDRLELMEEVFRKLDSYLSRKVLESEVGGK